uniref:Uncharacterized protein n=1 Tax=Glossina brevipalpis TaxID=37001 RepID=A0A1A9X4T5_9MUSC
MINGMFSISLIWRSLKEKTAIIYLFKETNARYNTKISYALKIFQWPLCLTLHLMKIALASLRLFKLNNIKM